MGKTSTERKEMTNWDYFLEGWNKAFDFDAIWNPEKYNNQDITIA